MRLGFPCSLCLGVGLFVAARAESQIEAPADYRQAHSSGFISLMEQLRAGEVGAARLPRARPGRAARGAPGADALVNDPTLDTPERTTQSETTIAVRNGTLCAGYVDTGPGGTSGISRSTDRAQTWEDRGTIIFVTDPVLAVHRASGRFYLAKIAIGPGVGITIGVFSSDDDCQTFPNYAVASPVGSLPIHSQDKPWIAVDNTGGERDGDVYVCWTRFLNDSDRIADGDEIRFSRSLDGAATFIDDQVVSPPTDYFPFGCFVEVGAAGEVYVSWSDRNSGNAIRFRRSFDGGVTWEPVVQVNSRPIRPPGIDRFRECELGVIRPTLNGDIRQIAQTWMAADTTRGPFDGNIYLVWVDDPVGDIDNADVYYSRSVDGGLTWGEAQQLGGGTLTDQFEPFVEVGRTGALTIAWYDRRNDPANELIDVYAVVSRDGGESFGPLVRITDVSFPVPPLRGQPNGNFDPGRNACYMGEYIGVAADEAYFYYLWGDNRNTLVTPLYPGGRPDPDVYSDRLPVPGVCGDGVVDEDERCDDRNRIGADGCSAVCLPEGDANCDERVTAADIVALTTLTAQSERAPCGEDDANHDGDLDASDLPILVSGVFS